MPDVGVWASFSIDPGKICLNHRLALKIPAVSLNSILRTKSASGADFKVNLHEAWHRDNSEGRQGRVECVDLSLIVP